MNCGACHHPDHGQLVCPVDGCECDPVAAAAEWARRGLRSSPPEDPRARAIANAEHEDPRIAEAEWRRDHEVDHDSERYPY